MIAASQTASLPSSTSDFSGSTSLPRVTAASPGNIDQVTGESSPSIAPVATFVLWSVCLLVGSLGFVLPYSRPRPPVPAPEPVVVEKLVVELANEALPMVTMPVDPLSPPPPPSAVAEPQVAQAIAVAEPSAVAFALPVEGPTITVATEHAAHSRASAVGTAVIGLPAAQTLVFGHGDGRQPAPEYPTRSAKLGQEGVVDIRLTVDASGQVVDTAVASPCAWPLLNEAAERTVRHRWRFSRGATRVYEVAIRFSLAK